MRRETLIAALAAVAVTVSAQSAAAAAHYVQPGESLWSIASATGVSVGALAAANGLGADSQIISGTTLQIPVQSAAGTTQTSTTVQSSSSGGGHLIVAGETLSSIAAANGVSVSSLAAANGISTAGLIIAGTSLKIPGATTTASGCAAGCNTAGNVPVPTAERLSAQQVGDIGQSYGMSRTLMQAIGWQESGFNNAALSSANARGVMQIIPPTWNFINQNLAGGSLSTASAHDNVAAGALYLRYLYRLKGGDRDATIGSYYQGPGRQTVLPETQRYVSSVLGYKDWYAQHPK
jgi:LysM repeat protein